MRGGGVSCSLICKRVKIPPMLFTRQTFFHKESLIKETKLVFGKTFLKKFNSSDDVDACERLVSRKDLVDGLCIETACWGLVRIETVKYADDFSVLCGSEEEAEEAISHVKEILEELEL